MRARYILFLLLPFLLSSNIILAQSERTQIRWFVQATNDEGGQDSALIQFVNAYNLSQDSIELILDITTATCSFGAVDTLLARIAEGNPPDITNYPYRVLWNHYLDLTPYLGNYDLSQMDTTSFYTFRNSNGLVYLPLRYNTDLFYYNKDMFDSAGIPYPPHHYDSLYADGEVWDANKLIEIGSLLTIDENGHNASQAVFDPNHIVQYGFHWAWNNGIGFLGMFGSPQIVDNDGNVSIPQYMRNGYHWSHEGIWQQRFIPPMQVFMDTMQEDPLGSGRTAMVLSGSSYLNRLNDTLLHWDVAAIPSYNGTHSVCWEEGGFGILNTTSHPAEAMAVIMVVANVIDFYIGDGANIPRMNNLRAEVLERWETRWPNIDKQVILDGFDHRNLNTSADAIRYNMSAWRIMNDFRGYIWGDPNAQIDNGINYWLIPQLESIFQSTDVKNRSFSNIPRQCQLDQNYPNPFNPTTVIEFSVGTYSHTSLRVYDLLGREVATLVNENKPAGSYQVTWNANGLASGIYFYKLRAGKFVATKKMVLVR